MVLLSFVPDKFIGGAYLLWVGGLLGNSCNIFYLRAGSALGIISFQCHKMVFQGAIGLYLGGVGVVTQVPSAGQRAKMELGVVACKYIFGCTCVIAMVVLRGYGKKGSLFDRKCNAPLEGPLTFENYTITGDNGRQLCVALPRRVVIGGLISGLTCIFGGITILGGNLIGLYIINGVRGVSPQQVPFNVGSIWHVKGCNMGVNSRHVFKPNKMGFA